MRPSFLSVSLLKNHRRGLFTGVALAACLTLSGCFTQEFEKHEMPIPGSVLKLMASKGVDKNDDIFIRIFKKEAELEVWKKGDNGRYVHLKDYEICAWSGDLGPKFKEGDRQAPEGFYKVSPGLMNPNSSYHLSFNLGFPNAYDRSHGRTGSFLMVHGACSSAGCYSMEDEQIEEIYALAREAFLGGQKKFQVHAFPFRMTPENMATFKGNKHMDFWRTLKRGYEHFELTKVPPSVDACDRRYIFNARPVDEEQKFKADEACPEYEVAERVKTKVDEKVAADRVIEDTIIAGYTEDRLAKHAELTTRLKIERERMARFSDRGLRHSKHMKNRLATIQSNLVKLGYTANGELPAEVANAIDGLSK